MKRGLSGDLDKVKKRKTKTPPTKDNKTNHNNKTTTDATPNKQKSKRARIAYTEEDKQLERELTSSLFSELNEDDNLDTPTITPFSSLIKQEDSDDEQKEDITIKFDEDEDEKSDDLKRMYQICILIIVISNFFLY